MSRTMPPLLAAPALALVLAAATLVACDPRGARVAEIGRTRAVLNDGLCTFAATVTLRPDAHRTFARREREVRQALVAVLRTKSRYMVNSPTAREALRRQMLREVNRVLAEPVAEELRFTEFVLS